MFKWWQPGGAELPGGGMFCTFHSGEWGRTDEQPLRCEHRCAYDSINQSINRNRFIQHHQSHANRRRLGAKLCEFFIVSCHVKQSGIQSIRSTVNVPGSQLGMFKVARQQVPGCRRANNSRIKLSQTNVTR